MSVNQDTPGVIAKPPLICFVALVIGLVLRLVFPLPIMQLAVRLWFGIAVIIPLLLGPRHAKYPNIFRGL